MANMTVSTTRPHKGDISPQEYGMVGYTNLGGGSETQTIYKGACVCMDVTDVDGYAQPYQSGITAASDDVFLGVALEEKSTVAANTSDGAVKILVAQSGIWAFPVNSLSVTDIGAPIYAADDGNVVQSSSSNVLWIGYLVNVDATYAWVNIAPAAGRACSAT